MQNRFIKSILILLVWYFMWSILDTIISKYQLLSENILVFSIIGFITTLSLLYYLYNQSYFS